MIYLYIDHVMLQFICTDIVFHTLKRKDCAILTVIFINDESAICN